MTKPKVKTTILPLKDFTDIIMGQSPPSSSYNENKVGIPFYQGITEFGEKYPGLRLYTTDPKKIAPKGSVLFSVRAPVGQVNITTQDSCIGRGNAALNMKNGNNEYLYYLLKANERYIQDFTSGTVYSSISGAELKDIPFNIPTEIPEQKRISSILSSFDNKIELLKKQNKTLENIAQTIFKQWFIDFNFPNSNGKPYKDNGGKMIDSELGLIPEGWRVGRLEEIVNFLNGYAFKSKKLLTEECPDCYSIFKMGHIKKGGGFNDSKTKSYIQKNKCLGLERYILHTGDILMSMTDMKDSVSLLGHTALMNRDDQFILNQRVGLLREKKDQLFRFPYLYILTNMQPFLGRLRQGANSGVQVNLSTYGIKNTSLVIPSKNSLVSYNKISLRLFEKIIKNQKQIKILQKERFQLLNKLIN